MIIAEEEKPLPTIDRAVVQGCSYGVSSCFSLTGSDLGRLLLVGLEPMMIFGAEFWEGAFVGFDVADSGWPSSKCFGNVSLAVASGPNGAAEPGVQRLDNVGRANDFADLRARIEGTA